MTLMLLLWACEVAEEWNDRCVGVAIAKAALSNDDQARNIVDSDSLALVCRTPPNNLTCQCRRYET
jgi:hypothetical protein